MEKAYNRFKNDKFQIMKQNMGKFTGKKKRDKGKYEEWVKARRSSAAEIEHFSIAGYISKQFTKRHRYAV